VTDLSLRLLRFLPRLALAGLALTLAGPLAPALRAENEHAQLEPKTSDELTKVKDLTDAKNWDGAISLLLGQLPNVSPTSFDTAVISQVLSKIYMQKSDYGRALEAMQTAVRLSDSYDYLEPREVQEMVYYLALIYNQESANLKSVALQQQYLSKATDYAKRWLDHNTKTGQDPQTQDVMLFYVNMLYNRAVLNPNAIDRKLLKTCERAIEDSLLLINRPKETFYVLLLAAYQQEGNFARAAEIFELLVKQYPTKKDYWTQLVPIYLNLGFDKDEEKGREFNVRAIVTIERAQALGFMRTPKENFTLVGLYFNVGQFGKATELLYSGLKTGDIENLQSNWELLAYSYQQVDKPFQAIEVLKEAARHFPKSGQLDYQTATIYYSVDKADEAYRYLMSAVAKGHLEKAYAVYNFLAYVDYELGKFDEALVAVDRAIASAGAEHESQLPRLKQAIEDALKERELLKSGQRTQ
jgi:tetratricopeptide (TPR) repeat protein